ncbi:uncharacterized protein METZ01_LOCUS103306 [marine metagenome]|uniref:Uncharacterized protein n=1 Tax=marine metagenome TaxID=408172 RepID=A0A381WDC4_9ZZZZ
MDQQDLKLMWKFVRCTLMAIGRLDI